MSGVRPLSLFSEGRGTGVAAANTTTSTLDTAIPTPPAWRRDVDHGLALSVVAAISTQVTGKPKPPWISTSSIERQNLTIRTQLRRFTRLANACSKKLANLEAAIALHFAYYNFCRVHQTLRITRRWQRRFQIRFGR